MNKNDFLKYTAQNLKAYFPEEYKDLEITEVAVKKNGADCHGIMVKRDGEASPVIYMDQAFEAYRSGTSIYEILESVAESFEDALGWEFEESVKTFFQYENAREAIFLEMCDSDMNKEALQTCPSIPVGDFRAVFKVDVSAAMSEQASMLVTDSLMSTWGITYKELYRDALNNETQKRPPQLWSVMDILSSPLSAPTNLYESAVDKEALMSGEPQLYVLTHGKQGHGASVLAREEVLERVGEIFGEDYIVLPSSVQEVLIMPMRPDEFNEYGIDSLEAVVKEVNETMVIPQERLSYKVQHYDVEKNVLEDIRTWQERLSLEAKMEKGYEKQMRTEAAKEPFQNPIEQLAPKM